VDLRVDDHCRTSAPLPASSSQAFTVIDSMLLDDAVHDRVVFGSDLVLAGDGR